MSGAATIAAFRDDPGAWADPSLVAPLIAAEMRADTIRRLMASRRTGLRATHALAAQLGKGEPLAHEDEALVLAAPDQLDRIAAEAGAVWHAARVRALVRGSEIAALAARFGPTARQAALRHASPASQDAGTFTDDLADDIARDGEACVAAWVASLPQWAAVRLRLVRPWSEGPHPAAAQRIALVHRLAVETL